MLSEVESRKTDLKKINPEATEEEMMEIIQSQQIDVLDVVLDKRKGKEIRGMGRGGERDLSQSSSGSTLRNRAPPNQDRERIERLEREVREYKERTELAEAESAWYRNQYTSVNSRMDQLFSCLGLEPEGQAPPPPPFTAPPHSSPGPPPPPQSSSIPPPPQSSLIPPPTQSSPPPLPTQSSPAFVDDDQFLNLY
uniref:protein diaphanous homolog 2-like n=1 Tax=Fragaria vesca subsp. vesca TaxID=101020 RepID=UPI0005CA341C|nr:PREDICTED: protein diaphanous homolog 2-like [Fragaria vesca subsp. vesca]